MKLFQRGIDLVGYARQQYGDSIRIKTNFNLTTDEYQGYNVQLNDKIVDVLLVKHYSISRRSAKKVLFNYKNTYGVIESFLEDDNNGGVHLTWQELIAIDVLNIDRKFIKSYVKDILKDKENTKFYLTDKGITIVNPKKLKSYYIGFKLKY